MAGSQNGKASIPTRRTRAITENIPARPKACVAPLYHSARRPSSYVAASSASGQVLPEDGSLPDRVRTLQQSQATGDADDGCEVTSVRSLIREDQAELVNSPDHPAQITRTPSLHYESSLARSKSKSVANSIAESTLQTSRGHPTSLPTSRAGSLYLHAEGFLDHMASVPTIPLHMQEDLWRLTPLQKPLSPSRASSQRTLGPRPRASFTRLSSYENIRAYWEEKEAWKRASSTCTFPIEQLDQDYLRDRQRTSPDGPGTPLNVENKHMCNATAHNSQYTTPACSPPSSVLALKTHPHPHDQNRFRHFPSEVGFCFTIAMTQFIAEYMISGFAIELPKIINRYSDSSTGGIGMFWPASLLSLILSATLLGFARISDMHGGYLPFMFGVVWLGTWSVVAGFAGIGTLLDVARAMQGLAVAAFTPAAFTMVGSAYPDGKRKNTVLGLYAGCAPLGFFAGFLVAGALPSDATGWYFWIASACSIITAITAYLTVPNDRTDRQRLNLSMDWVGAFLITAGLILVSYALAVEPYANTGDTSRSGWSYPMVLAPLIAGLVCLLIAFWVEGWWATCPLLPLEFLHPKSVKAFCLACLCFYATYGVWLYESAQFFESESTTGVPGGIRGLQLAAWYAPTAVGGLTLCFLGGYLADIVPIMAILLLSALAWLTAPLLLALCPLPVHYWSYVMPSMLCATLGIDLTFTVSCVFLSAVQPLRYQGLAGAVTSILVNLAMSFSLSISEIVVKTASSAGGSEEEDSQRQREVRGFRAAFLYAAASAGVGLVVCVLFVRISRSSVQGKKEESGEDGEEQRANSEASTLVELET